MPGSGVAGASSGTAATATVLSLPAVAASGPATSRHGPRSVTNSSPSRRTRFTPARVPIGTLSPSARSARPVAAR